MRAEQGFDMVSVTTDTSVIAEGMVGALNIAQGGTASGSEGKKSAY